MEHLVWSKCMGNSKCTVSKQNPHSANVERVYQIEPKLGVLNFVGIIAKTIKVQRLSKFPLPFIVLLFS
jgi:hypothetical protein